MVGAFIQFVRNLETLGIRKRGRPPVFNANQFYPFAIERELQEMTTAELLRSMEESIRIALQGERFGDTLEDLLNNPSELPKDFKGRLPKITSAISAKVTADFAKQSEMTIGQPYYPPAAKDDIFKTWEQNFQQLCISAESEAKKDISRIVAESKQKGWNAKQTEAAIREKLPAKYRHRAELIARTEIGKLNSAARLSQFKEIGIEYYKWMTTCDGRERTNHKHLNNVICSVSDPRVYFVETPDGLEKKTRNPAMMFIGNPGEDFQCRCSMVSWTPEIDGKYKVAGPTQEEIAKQEAEAKAAEEKAALEAAEEAAKKEAERVAREEAEKAARIEAERKAQAAEHKLEILRKAQKRHELRSPEERAEIQARWDERARKRRLAAAAEKRHAARTPEQEQDIVKRLNYRLGVRKIVNEVISEAEGINGLDLDRLKEVRKGGKPEQYAEMENLANDIRSKLDELKNLQYVENGIEEAKKFSYDEIIQAEKAIEAKVKKWSSLPLSKQQSNYEYEIDYVEKNKKYSTWEIAKRAYEKKLSEVKILVKWEDLSKKLEDVVAYSKTTSSKQLKDLIAEAEAAKQSKDLSEFTKKVFAAEFKKDALEKNKLYKQGKKQGSSSNQQNSSQSSQNSSYFGISNGKQTKEMPSGMSDDEKLEAVKTLCNVDEATAKDLISAVDGFSWQWDYEIRQYQIGNSATLVSRHGHSINAIKKKAEDLEEFIKKSPKWAGGDTYRGMSLSQKSIDEYIDKYKNGIAIDMRGSASFSTQQSTAESFSRSHIGQNDPNGDVMTERAIFLQPNGQPMGTSIRHLSQFAGEHEILLSKDASWKITNYRQDASSGIHYFTIDAL